MVPYFIAAIFPFGTATAKDIQTVLITRFFTGLFGSAPVTNTGSVMADIWPPQQRGIAIFGYAITIVGGPTLGPIIGGILYATLEAFSIEFQEISWWGPVVGNLPFISLLVGIFFAAAFNIYNNKYHFNKFKANGNKAVLEARLPPMMIGGFAFTAGLFVFGWTSSQHMNYWPSIIGIALTGFGFTTIFQAALNYLVDTFTRFSANVVAANTFLRSMMAGAFPLFVVPMYHNIGVNWGTTVSGCFAAILIPVPFLFFIWGRDIRARGK
ncbi:hypothetical protein PoHVEF18_002263 [Penicillium ochrochloron]